MEVLAIVLPFVLLGAAVLYVAFSGGPSEARQAYLAQGNRAFRLAIPVVYVIGGVLVPALIVVNRGAAAGGTDTLSSESLSKDEEEGKSLFSDRCGSCHNLDATNSRGVTGPDLDEVGQLTPKRVVAAIERGGTGQKRMPAGIFTGKDAEDVALYVSKVAGR